MTRASKLVSALSFSSTSYRIGWLDILQCEKLPSFISAPFGSETLFGSVTIYVLSTLMEKWKKKTQKGFSDLKKTNKQNKRCPTLFSDFFSSRWLAINYIILMDKSNCDELKWRIKKWDLRWSINSPFRRHMFIVVLKLAVDLVKKKTRLFSRPCSFSVLSFRQLTSQNTKQNECERIFCLLGAINDLTNYSTSIFVRWQKGNVARCAVVIHCVYLVPYLFHHIRKVKDVVILTRNIFSL